MSQATEKLVMTTFSCHAPQAEHVSVAGTFNDWCGNTNMMKKGAKGKWTTKIKLAPGRYEFKFIVDGEWCCEPGCDGPHTGCSACVANECGTMNRVIDVK